MPPQHGFDYLALKGDAGKSQNRSLLEGRPAPQAQVRFTLSCLRRSLLRASGGLIAGGQLEFRDGRRDELSESFVCCLFLAGSANSQTTGVGPALQGAGTNQIA